MAATRKPTRQGKGRRESVEQRTKNVITPKILPKLFEEMGTACNWFSQSCWKWTGCICRDKGNCFVKLKEEINKETTNNNIDEEAIGSIGNISYRIN